MSAAQVLDMALYDPHHKDDPMTSITIRVPKSLVKEMDAVVRLWKVLAAHRGDDVRGIDRSHVMRSLLRSGYVQAFAEFSGEPENDADWERIEATIIKALKKSR